MTLLIMGLAFSTPFVSQSGSVMVAKADKNAKKSEKNIWSYVTSKEWHKGACPPTRPGKGLLSLNKQGSKATLKILSGLRCSPKAVCTCKGSFKGKNFRCSKTVTVDGEGGKANNTFHFVQKSPKRMTGTVKSWYRHPKGFKCSWGFNVTLKKK